MTSLTFRSMILRNFKGFSGKHEFVLDRNPGLYYIAGNNKRDPDMGANGVGKSTLWDALLWVLWGKTGRDNRPANAVLPWDQDEGGTSVKLKFTRAGKRYMLTRSRNPNDLVLSADGVGKTITQDEVPRLIGMSEEIFRRAIVLGQFGTLFLDLKPEAQAQMFNEGLSLDLYLKASKAAGNRQSNLEAQARQAWAIIQNVQSRRAELEKSLALQEDLSNNFLSNQTKKRRELEDAIQGAREDGAALARKARDGLLAGGKGSGKPLPIPALIKAQEASLEALTGQAQSWETEAQVARRELASLAAVEADYEAALKGSGTCPACGQKVAKDHLKDKLKEITDQIGKLEVDRHKKALKKRDAYYAQIDDQRKRLNFLKDLQRNIEANEEFIASETRALEKLASEENPYKDAIADLRKRMKKADDLLTEQKDKATALDQEAGCYGFWVAAFKEIRLKLIDETLAELEIATIRHAEALGLDSWRIEFKTEREKKSGDISTGFTTLLYPPGSKDAIKWESYSGGESQRWQMAVAFGLSEVLLARAGVEPNIEVLDEPTRGLSPEGVEDLLEHLAERARDLGRSIYVVEHHSLERGLFADTIMITKDRSGSYIEG